MDSANIFIENEKEMEGEEEENEEETCSSSFTYKAFALHHSLRRAIQTTCSKVQNIAFCLYLHIINSHRCSD